jgi:aspartyl-tRNA(Asn)/glutamyl-tRNA(Gln) amidotransferase subunit A
MNRRRSDPSDKKQALLKSAESLPFGRNEIDIEQCLKSVDILESAADNLYQQHREGESDEVDFKQGDDEYGSLLYIYEQPQSSVKSGLLSGARVGVKDNIAVRGLPLTCGSEVLCFTPSYDAVVVERLRNKGANIVGKTNLDAFAFGPSGEFSERREVKNPISPGRIPGGSSSGSGAAVAAGLLDIALGTDTGGSVRIPAACCGIVGAKPTHGLVPRHGLVSFAPSLDTIGPLAQNVQTAANALEAMAGHEVRDPSSHYDSSRPLSDLNLANKETLEIGIGQPFVERSTATVSSAFTNALAEIESHASINISTVNFEVGHIEEAYFLTGATEFAWLLRQHGIIRGQGTEYEEQWRRAVIQATENETLNSHIASRVLPSIHLDDKTQGRAYTAARRETIEFTQRLNNLFEEIDLLLTPTIRSLPPKLGQISASERLNDLLGNTAPFNLSGMPAVSVPVAERDGLPISAQVVAPRFADHRALSGARIVKQNSPLSRTDSENEH